MCLASILPYTHVGVRFGPKPVYHEKIVIGRVLCSLPKSSFFSYMTHFAWHRMSGHPFVAKGLVIHVVFLVRGGSLISRSWRNRKLLWVYSFLSSTGAFSKFLLRMHDFHARDAAVFQSLSDLHVGPICILKDLCCFVPLPPSIPKGSNFCIHVYWGREALSVCHLHDCRQFTFRGHG